MSNRKICKTKQLDKAKNALFFSNVGFWILAAVYFLLGPVSTLVYLSALGFDGQGSITGAVVSVELFVGGVLLFGSVPIVMAVGLNIIALTKVRSLPSVDGRKVMWQSISILLAIPAIVFMFFVCGFLSDIIDDFLPLSSAVMNLIDLVMCSIVLMVFVVVPIVKTKR